jgi:hypothetical protein
MPDVAHGFKFGFVTIYCARQEFLLLETDELKLETFLCADFCCTGCLF